MTFIGDKRIHIGLTTARFEEALDFYRNFFGVEPAKRREGYAKFELVSPPVNFTLNETKKSAPFQRLSHLGIQVKHSQEVEEAQTRLSHLGWETRVEKNTSCCYALQDKVWVKDPDGNPWETFVVHKDDENQNTTKACCG